jgi:hypothetical protein
MFFNIFHERSVIFFSQWRQQSTEGRCVELYVCGFIFQKIGDFFLAKRPVLARSWPSAGPTIRRSGAVRDMDTLPGLSFCQVS